VSDDGQLYPARHRTVSRSTTRVSTPNPITSGNRGDAPKAILKSDIQSMIARPANHSLMALRSPWPLNSGHYSNHLAVDSAIRRGFLN